MKDPVRGPSLFRKNIMTNFSALSLIASSILSISLLDVSTPIFNPPFPARQAGAEITQQSLHLQASSPIPVNDLRVAELWLTNADRLDRIDRRCTANLIGEKLWITALHCFDGLDEPRGAVVQSESFAAGIEKVFFLSQNDDLAILRVSNSSEESPFQLSDSPLRESEQATLIGYGGANSFPSEARVKVRRHINLRAFDGYDFQGLLETESVTQSRTCFGDSGGALYVGDQIVAVHTAGDFNAECSGSLGSHMWHTDISSRREWIEDILGRTEGASSDEARIANEGLSTFYDFAIRPVRAASSSALSASSSGNYEGVN